jgi:hypothetical protein
VQGQGGPSGGIGGAFTGGTSGAGALITGGSGAPGAILNPGAGQATAAAVNGLFDFRSAPTGSSTVDRQQGPSNLLRAWARCQYTTATSDPTLLAGFNVSAVAYASFGHYYLDVAFDMGTSCCVVVSDFTSASGLQVRTVETGQSTVGGKTRIAFQVVNTQTGNVVSAVAPLGFNVQVTAL